MTEQRVSIFLINQHPTAEIKQVQSLTSLPFVFNNFLNTSMFHWFDNTLHITLECSKNIKMET